MTVDFDLGSDLDTLPVYAARRAQVDGAEINFYEFGDPEATPIVFLHGGGPGCTGWHDWGKVGVHLLDSHRCLFVDLPQFGASSYEPIQGPTFTVYARWLEQFLDTAGLDRVHMVCQSFGGSVALRLAVDAPERFLGMSLTGTTPTSYGILTPPPIQAVARRVLGAYYGGEGPTEAKLRELLAEVEWVDRDAIPAGLVRSRFAISSSPEAKALQKHPSPQGTAEDLGPILDLNTVPTLLFYGDQDPFAPAEIPLHLFTRFPKGRLVILKNASHHFPEEYPARALAIIRPWLDECERAALNAGTTAAEPGLGSAASF